MFDNGEGEAIVFSLRMVPYCRAWCDLGHRVIYPLTRRGPVTCHLCETIVLEVVAAL